MKIYYKGCGEEVNGECQDYLEQKENEKLWVAEPKYDGQWQQITWTNGISQAHSRNGKIKPIPQLSVPLKNTIMVGESSYGSQYMQNKYGQVFVAFDIIVYEGQCCEDLTYNERREILYQLINQLNYSQLLCAKSVLTGFNQLYDEEHEGVVLKRLNQPYRIGKQWDWVKIKKHQTSELIVVGVNISEAPTIKGLAQSIICKDPITGAITEVGNMDHFARVGFRDGKHNGKMVEIKHWGKFKSGALRHPSFVRLREDK